MTTQYRFDDSHEIDAASLLGSDQSNLRRLEKSAIERFEKVRRYKTRSIRSLLKKFHFDVEIPHPELNRVNNMAWEFMQVDDMRFQEAMTLAAQIVAHCEIAACEASYVNVKMLWERINQPLSR